MAAVRWGSLAHAGGAVDTPCLHRGRIQLGALRNGLEQYSGTVLAVTHDRWFAAGHDRYPLSSDGGRVVETPEPVWHEGRVQRRR